MEQEKSLSNELEMEELLAALKNADEDQNVSENEVLRFCAQFNIKQGDYPIKKNLLHKIYKMWSKNPLKKKEFVREITNYFRSTQYNFFINLDVFKVSRILLEKTGKQKRIQPYQRYKVQKHFKEFLDRFEIEKGEFYISWSALYYLYDKWCYNLKKDNELNTKNFVSICKATLNTKQPKNKILHVGVKKTIIYHIPSNVIDELRNSIGYYGKQTKKEPKIKD